jgi:alkaline phosphatase D
MPMIAQWDEHDFANDAWSGGAQNHQPDEGLWSTRKAAAMQAWREWLPVSEEPWKAYDIGGLATLFRTETRVLGRTKQRTAAELLAARDARALLDDPAMTMMGSTQEAWLAGALARSVREGRRWQIVGSGTVVGRIGLPRDAD